MKHVLIKDHIVKTASHLFYQNGYNLTGINEIIKEAGIAKATLYNHFKSKEDICVAYLQHKNNTFIADIKGFVASKKVGEERVLALFDYLDQFYKTKEFNGCWCINTISEIPKENKNIRAEIISQKQILINFINELIKENVKNMSIQKTDTISRQVYLLYESAVSESHLQNDIWPIHSAKQICQQII